MLLPDCGHIRRGFGQRLPLRRYRLLLRLRSLFSGFSPFEKPLCSTIWASTEERGVKQCRDVWCSLSSFSSRGTAIAKGASGETNNLMGRAMTVNKWIFLQRKTIKFCVFRSTWAAKRIFEFWEFERFLYWPLYTFMISPRYLWNL